MGGVWEKQIKSARTILMSLLHTHGRSLNDESLRTLLAETEATVNSRPSTVRWETCRANNQYAQATFSP